MEYTIFHNRKKELDFLDSLYSDKKPKVVDRKYQRKNILGRIIDETGLDKGLVSKYISVLIDLHILERRVPITELNPSKSRRGRYRIKDNFFKFWFRFIFSNAHYLEQHMYDFVLNEKISPNLNTFIGEAF